MKQKFENPGQRLVKKFGNERGQAATEYILILVIIVIIILGLLYRFNSSFKAYAEAYFGDYVACLLETGELPGVKNAQCTAEYKPYDPKAGKGLVDGLKGNGGSGGGGKNGEEGGGAKASNGGSGSGGGGGETRGGGGGRGVAAFNGNKGKPRVAQVKTGGSSTKEESDTGGDLSPSNSVAVGRVSNGLRADGGRIQYIYYEDQAEEEKQERPKSVTARAEDTEKFRPRKVTEKPWRAPAADDDGKQKEFSISDLVRLLIMIILIVALILFLGGQLIQISKGREKGGDA